jgi:heat shock protein HtpX
LLPFWHKTTTGSNFVVHRKKAMSNSPLAVMSKPMWIRKLSDKSIHFWRSMLFLGTMVALMAALGYSFFGWGGLLMASALAVFAFWGSQRIPLDYLMRMYRARPLSQVQAPQLYAHIRGLAARAQLAKMPKVYYIHSGALNAFATGAGNEMGVAVTAGLLQQLPERELVGVLAHEMSHLRHRDLDLSRVAMVVRRMTRFFALAGQLLLFINLPLLLMGELTLPWSAILLLLLAPGLSVLLQLAISRDREFDADRAAVALTGDPEGLANALERIDWLNKGGWRQWFFNGPQQPRMKIPSWLSTHPSLQERISRLRSW